MTKSLSRAVQKIMAPIVRRTLLMIGRGVYTRTLDPNGLAQVQLEALTGEVIDTDRPQPFGFKSNPIEGDAIFVCVNGNRDHPLVIVVDDRFCPVDLGPGEICLYNANGDYTHFRNTGEIQTVAEGDILVRSKTGEIRLEAAGAVTVVSDTKIVLSAPEVRVGGNLGVGGDIGATGRVSATDLVRSIPGGGAFGF